MLAQTEIPFQVDIILYIVFFVAGPILLGLSFIFAQEFYWKLRVASDAFRGKKSERTRLWYFWQYAAGIFLVGFGLFMLYGFFNA